VKVEVGLKLEITFFLTQHLIFFIPKISDLSLEKKLACFNPNLGQIWTNPNVGLKMQLNIFKLKVKVEVGLKFEITIFLTQHLIFFNPTMSYLSTYTQKKSWVVSNMDKPKFWVKNAIKDF